MGKNASSRDSVRGFVIECMQGGPVTKKNIMDSIKKDNRFDGKYDDDKKLLKYINTLISKIKKNHKVESSSEEYAPGKFRGLYKITK